MGNILVIGGGFSAALVLSKLSGQNVRVFSPDASLIASGHNEFETYSQFSYNKLLGKKAKSASVTQFGESANINLHNRVKHGGNSLIWGGFYRGSDDFDWQKDLSLIGAIPVPLSLDKTGSISNSSRLYQLQNQHGNLYSSLEAIKDYENKFVKKIIVNSGYIEVDYFDLDVNRSGREKFDNVYFCGGAVNTISILYESFGVSHFEMEESPHSLSFVSLRAPFSDNYLSIRYTIDRAICHFLGHQKMINFKAVNPKLLLIEQRFEVGRKNFLSGRVNNGVVELNKVNCNKFGDSIHYCGLRINGFKLNDWIQGLTSRIKFFGMMSIEQDEPGPISNDIHDSVRKFFEPGC